MLTYHIGNAFRFHFLFPALLAFLRGNGFGIVQLGMGNFMHQRLDGLDLAHTGPENDTIFHRAEIAIGFPGANIDLHRNRGKAC